MTSQAQRFFLLGPTASGKTAISLALAPRLNAEILSLDSMLVYRGMDLGTAKPDAEEQAVVRHHLIDLVGPQEEFSVSRYRNAALQVEAALAEKGKRALYAGGTPLYFKALVHGLHELPPVPPELRQELLALAADKQNREALRRELAEVDPRLAAKIHPNDDRRLLRGLETWRTTQKPLTEWQAQWRVDDSHDEGRLAGVPAIALRWEREALRERVARRFHMMLEQGFLEEVRRIDQTSGFSVSASKAIGYRQVLAHLHGECTLDEAVEQAITRTRVFIRRQMTWLRSFPDLQWLDVS